MEIHGSRVLILGGSGLVGLAIARQLLSRGPASLVVTALTEAELREGLEVLRPLAGDTELLGEWGNLFTPAVLKTATRDHVLDDAGARGALLDALFGPLGEEVVRGDTLGEMVLRHRPEIVVDCVNTATAFAYRNVFKSAAAIREAARRGPVDLETVEKHLVTLTLPPLIHHMWIALSAMTTVGTRVYLKVGTAGTGGMGLNIPFTHSEDRPSRQLLAKASVAGAQTLLLYLMARTPGAPAVKEIKPTAAISWKAIRAGEVVWRGEPIRRVDAVGPVPLAEAFPPGGPGGARSDAGRDTVWRETGETLTGVYLDSGENGLFSPDEFEAISSLGLMEFITPEEIATDAVREILGHPTGHDVVAALDASTSGPTYRAGVLRETALRRMDDLQRERGERSVAFEMLGPPRLTKLLYEGEILRRLFGSLDDVAALDAADVSARADRLVAEDPDLRTRILSAKLAILLPGGDSLLRGRRVEIEPSAGETPAQAARRGWVDLRPECWSAWRERAGAILAAIEGHPGADGGSGWDMQPWHLERTIRPGALAAWILRHEDRGERIKR
jgi:NAD(P)-dependent dehydrogenase (short-subunit alcohol dehydrogenase family)